MLTHCISKLCNKSLKFSYKRLMFQLSHYKNLKLIFFTFTYGYIF